ncbi:Protein N-acetyltransferase, RimJ/RimL family [Aliiroseovarius crassostreae]|uniref:N-acetyltransferase domain-containing protein n=1 Tax=Aliiroseovarius crassostreae TaxID=154981 RepID=A0A0N8IBY7_9RHOB|nr:GNAT family N-acetyltransferase [Aliiroseovarius crassostreae]KPN64419.1 hypothetical protein AKJ29_17550 [Aliiroseovarius crassostreae]SFU34536.1 Protein N-acetyltransferase, RimJ/RimL family [Aliiroseovarius crassostreae]
MNVTIETPRLVLRQPEMGDWEAFAAFLGSDRASFIGGPYSDRNAWRAFGHMAGHWALLGFGLFVGVEKSSGKPVLSAGPWKPVGWPEAEIGWSVWDPSIEGKGLAFEAALATRGWAYETLGWDTCVSYIDEDNLRSVALAKRLGCEIDPDAPRFKVEEPLDANPYHVWRHPAPDTDGNPEAYA